MSNATDDKSLVIYVMFLVEIEAFNHNILHSQVRNDIIIDCQLSSLSRKCRMNVSVVYEEYLEQQLFFFSFILSNYLSCMTFQRRVYQEVEENVKNVRPKSIAFLAQHVMIGPIESSYQLLRNYFHEEGNFPVNRGFECKNSNFDVQLKRTFPTIKGAQLHFISIVHQFTSTV